MIQVTDTGLTIINTRLAFASLYHAKPFSDGGKPKFQAKFLIEKDRTEDIQVIKSEIVKVATAKWADKTATILKGLMAEGKLCFADGDNKAWEGFPGNFYISASNDVKPATVDRQAKEVLEQSGVLYSGCYVIAKVSFWAQDNKWGKRVNANLRGVQFYRDGEAFTGGGAASVNEFEAQEPAAANTFAGNANADLF